MSDNITIVAAVTTTDVNTVADENTTDVNTADLKGAVDVKIKRCVEILNGATENDTSESNLEQDEEEEEEEDEEEIYHRRYLRELPVGMRCLIIVPGKVVNDTHN